MEKRIPMGKVLKAVVREAVRRGRAEEGRRQSDTRCRAAEAEAGRLRARLQEHEPKGGGAMVTSVDGRDAAWWARRADEYRRDAQQSQQALEEGEQRHREELAAKAETIEGLKETARTMAREAGDARAANARLEAELEGERASARSAEAVAAARALDADTDTHGRILVGRKSYEGLVAEAEALRAKNGELVRSLAVIRTHVEAEPGESAVVAVVRRMGGARPGGELGRPEQPPRGGKEHQSVDGEPGGEEQR